MLIKNLNLLLVLLLLSVVNLRADSAFVYEEGVSQQKQTQDSNYTANKVKSTPIEKNITPIKPESKNLSPSTTSQVELPKNKPESFYQNFLRNTKKGAVIALVITMIFFIVALGTGNKRVFIGAPLAGFPIIWLIVTLVCVFVTSC